MTDDISQYEIGWTDKMIEIWDEKLTLLGVYDTGSLLASLNSNIAGNLIEFRFLQYGIYQDSGVGYLYKGHEGDIPFLDQAYREEHGLDVPKHTGPAWGRRWTSGNPRKPRPWFNKKWYSSVMRLKEDIARIVGEEFIGIVQSIEGV